MTEKSVKMTYDYIHNCFSIENTPCCICWPDFVVSFPKHLIIAIYSILILQPEYCSRYVNILQFIVFFSKLELLVDTLFRFVKYFFYYSNQGNHK